MFEISPNCSDSIDSQIFKLMMLFDSRKDLPCMLGPFLASQLTWATIGAVMLPFFFSLQVFTRCLVKLLLDVVKKLGYLTK